MGSRQKKDVETEQDKLPGEASTIAFSPDGKLLATGSCDGTLTMYDVANGEIVARAHAAKGWGQQAFAFSPDGKFLATGDHARTVRLWKLPKLSLVHEMRHTRKYIVASAFSPDGKLLASSDGEQTIQIWDTKTAEQVGIARVAGRCLAFSPDGSMLAVGCIGDAKIYEVAALIGA